MENAGKKLVLTREGKYGAEVLGVFDFEEDVIEKVKEWGATEAEIVWLNDTEFRVTYPNEATFKFRIREVTHYV
jgi:hypothetical protein